MTGNELRQAVCDIINSWDGATKGSAKHKEILSIYNNHKPLAVGYTMQLTDAYCAATVSAAWIKAGIAEYTGTECSVGRFIELSKKKGTWVENDAYVPKIGDAVVYDWQDSGVGDNTGSGDHIGLVTAMNFIGGFRTTEGNMSGGKVGHQNMKINGRYIRGFIAPDYDAIAKALGGAAYKPTTQMETVTKFFTAPKTYRNGSTDEICYADTALTVKTGSLNKWESCKCLGIVDGRYLVVYQVDGTDHYKTGFVEYAGGVSA